jgi:hypothetical protein
MLGGNLPDNRELELKLFSNEEVLRVNQEGMGPRQLYKQDGEMVWLSDADSGAKYVAMFNIGDVEKEISLEFARLGIKKAVRIRDLWEKRESGTFKKKYTRVIPPHGAVLLKIISI